MTDPIIFGCVRANPIQNLSYLQGQEDHAKRTSPTSETRLGAVPGLALTWSILEDRPRDYVAAFQAAKDHAGARERESAAIGIHLLVSVGKEYVEEGGDVHDPLNLRNVKLFNEVINWAQRDVGGVFAARLDLDEAGSCVVDILAAPVSQRTARLRKDGSRGEAVAEISIRKMLKAASKKTHEKRSYSALQTLWARHARQHVDRRIRRGIPQEETGTAHLSAPAFRQLRAQLDQQQAHLEGMKVTARNTAVAAVGWQTELAEQADALREKESALERKERRIAEAELASSMILQSNVVELTAARARVEKREARVEAREQAVKASDARLHIRESRISQDERILEARRAAQDDEVKRRMRNIEETEMDLRRRLALQTHEMRRLVERDQRDRDALMERQKLLDAEEHRLVTAGKRLMAAEGALNELYMRLQRSPALAAQYPGLMDAADGARTAAKSARPSRVQRKQTDTDLEV